MSQSIPEPRSPESKSLEDSLKSVVIPKLSGDGSLENAESSSDFELLHTIVSSASSPESLIAEDDSHPSQDFTTGRFLPQAQLFAESLSFGALTPSNPPRDLFPSLQPSPFESWMGGPATLARNPFDKDALTHGGFPSPNPLSQEPISKEDTSFPWPWVQQEETPIWEKHWPLLGWDRYENRGFLASGGMGRVFQAWDPRLQRLVAIKFLKGDDPDLTQRFIHEAQIQAKVEHENVCKVFEVGQERGHAYIVMQFIQGEHLGKASKEMNRTQLAATMRKVAEGVHGAHRQGLIHRDLKPANIMAEHLEDGSWQPYVMDFGLARETTAQGQTQIGTILGTPSYMAPEQARGDVHQLDRRTDVYSLGATLYALLAGHPPFQSDSAYEVIRQVIEEDPKPLSSLDPSIPPDLEAIALKAMEKDPSKRYESARALGDDLQRYLDGEPVEARAVDWSYKLARKLHKNRLVLSVAGAGFLLTLGFLGLWLRSHWKSLEQTALATQLTEEALRMESILREAYLSPLHDVRIERAEVQERMRGIEQRMGQHDLARGPGHFALGKGYLALGDPEKAREHLEKAHHLMGATPELSFALGSALGQLYEKGYQELARVGDPKLAAARKEELIRNLRDPALAQLHKVHFASRSLAQVLGFLYHEQFQEALTKAQELLQKRPTDFDLLRLIVRIHLMNANHGLLSEKIAETQLHYDLSVEALEKLLVILRSDPKIFQQLTHLHAIRMDFFMLTGAFNPENEYSKALQAGEKAYLTNRDDPETWKALSMAHRLWIPIAREKGLNTAPAIQAFHKLADQLLKEHADQGLPWRIKADAWSHQARFASSPSESSQFAEGEAVACFRKAVGLNPKDYGSSGNLAIALANQGKDAQTLGQDPLPFWKEAESYYLKAGELDPSNPNTHNNLGDLYLHWGKYETSRGQDPRPTLAKALKHLQKASEMWPGDPYPVAVQAQCFAEEARWSFNRPESIPQLLTQGRQAAQKALELNPKWSMPWLVLGDLACVEAEHLLLQGKRPDEALQAAQKAFRESLKQNPGFLEAHLGLLETRLLPARYALVHGEKSLPLPPLLQQFQELPKEFKSSPRAQLMELEAGLLRPGRFLNQWKQLSAESQRRPRAWFLLSEYHLRQASQAQGSARRQSLEEARKALQEANKLDGGALESGFLLNCFRAMEDPANEATRRQILDHLKQFPSLRILCPDKIASTPS